MKCPSCETENEEGLRECKVCGNYLPKTNKEYKRPKDDMGISEVEKIYPNKEPSKIYRSYQEEWILERLWMFLIALIFGIIYVIYILVKRFI